MYKVRETPILDDIIYPNYPDYHHTHSTDYRNPQSYRHNHRNIHTYPYRDSYLTGSSNMTTVTQDSTDQLSVTPLVSGTIVQPTYGVIAKGRLSRPNSIMVSRPNSVHEIQSMCSEKKIDIGDQQANARASLFRIFSSLYAKLLIVGCFAFLISEILSQPVTPYYYEVFFLYLYAGSVFFLLYVYLYILREKKVEVISEENHEIGDTESYSKNADYQMSPITSDPPLPATNPKQKKKKATQSEKSVGSFYLRVGVVAFGVGGMIFNGLEFGKFFETKPSSPCFNIMLGVTPLAHTVFTFFQLYFLFMNSRMCIHKYKTVARFGLMHMFATNVCVWLRTLIRETMHDMNEFNKKTNGSSNVEENVLKSRILAERREEIKEIFLDRAFNSSFSLLDPSENSSTNWNSSVAYNLSLTPTELLLECTKENYMQKISEDAGPFLFPFIIEYSLIASAILYIIWKNIGNKAYENECIAKGDKHYKVDCTKANKGLFLGLLILVICIINLILFFVLIRTKLYDDEAILIAHTCDAFVEFLATIITLVAFIQMRVLNYQLRKHLDIDDLLLYIGLIGIYSYSIFSLIACYHNLNNNKVKTLPQLISSVILIFQATIQTALLQDTSRRYTASETQMAYKPGRESITFLLVCNIALWIVSSFETQRLDANDLQVTFYGVIPWTVLMRISLPMAIFYRFHSSVYLAEVWKTAYKNKSK